MKKIIFITSVGLLFFCLSSCKKGEDDPAFTLLTRKARLEGDWKMKEGNIKLGIKDSTGVYAALVYKLNETSYTHDIVGNGGHFEEKCKLELLITKNGHITIKQVMDSVDIESSGTWDFLGKTGKNKNKESINIQLNTLNNSSGWYRLFNKASTNFNYKIKELRNKKLVLFCEEEMIEITSGYGVYVTSEYTFTQ